jgi:hypothetical protein
MKKIIIALLLALITVTSTKRLAAQGSLDMLDFFVGDSSTWPRSGGQQMNQVTGYYTLTFVKWAQSWSYEMYYGDSSLNIYHWEDNTANSTGPYRFSDHLWLNRYMSVNDEIDHPYNVLTQFDQYCSQVDQYNFPYKTKLEAYWPSYDTQSDLGTRDIAVVTYTPYNNHSYFERFFYARGAGWAGWQVWDNGSMQGQVLFTTIGGSNTQPQSPCAAPPTP